MSQIPYQLMYKTNAGIRIKAALGAAFIENSKIRSDYLTNTFNVFI
jgi:hypothetical protein